MLIYERTVHRPRSSHLETHAHRINDNWRCLRLSCSRLLIDYQIQFEIWLNYSYSPYVTANKRQVCNLQHSAEESGYFIRVTHGRGNPSDGHLIRAYISATVRLCHVDGEYSCPLYVTTSARLNGQNDISKFLIFAIRFSEMNLAQARDVFK